MKLADEIKKTIEQIDFEATAENIGTVVEIKDGVVIAEGLSQVSFNELVEIQTESGVVQALALNLEEMSTGLVVLGDFTRVKEGDLVKTTGKLLSIQVDDTILGQVITPLGFVIDSDNKLACPKGKEVSLEKIAPGVMDRKNVDRPLQTGIKAIDAMIPIGKGQRELIIGDRQTGKTAVALDTIVNQKGKDVFCIYVAIGQKASKIAQIRAKLEDLGALEYTVIVSATASSPASLQYLAPYAGCAIGEYFAQQGKDALVIYDDLTKHAWAYREISLLLRRPPGREAYPGDIFYLHSKLLERALQYSDEQGGGSLTALPIIETQAGDLSAYIPTNVISITDGQIFLESGLFNAGQRPAINVGLSVSRVGGDAQIKAMKQVAGQLKLDLAQFRELESFAQFGSDLDEETMSKIERGRRILEILKQSQYKPLDVAVQVGLLYSAINGYLDKYDVQDLSRWEENFISNMQAQGKAFAEAVENGEKVEGDVEQVLIDIINNTDIV